MTDVVALAVALFLAHLTPGATAVPVAWTVVFAALVIGLLSTKRMYWPPLELRVLDATRSIVTAVAIAAAITIALRGLLTDASAVAEETIEPWLLATAFVVAGRIWLIGRAPRQEKGRRRSAHADRRCGERRAADCEETRRASRGGVETGRVPRQGAASRRRRNRPPCPRSQLGPRADRQEKRIEHVIVTFSTAPEEGPAPLAEALRAARDRDLARPAPVREVDRARHRRPSRRRPAHCAPLSQPEELAVCREARPGSRRRSSGTSRPCAIMGALALAVWASVGRPIFYRAERVGRDGRRFDMLKFRTMLPMTEEERIKPRHRPGDGDRRRQQQASTAERAWARSCAVHLSTSFRSSSTS